MSIEVRASPGAPEFFVFEVVVNIMKTMIKVGLACIACFLSPSVFAQINGDPEVMAAKGKGELTHEQFNAAANRIDAARRFPTIRNRSRMEDLLNRLLLHRQLVADAREAGFEEDPVVQERMKLAADEELAEAWLAHYVNESEPADYTAMAREEFILNRDSYQSPETIDVTHILIDTKSRNEQEAFELATELRARLEKNPEQFGELVMEYSDDPSKARNAGSFSKVKRGDMVEPFEARAFTLQPNEISEPVKTPFGYHLIRLDKINPAAQQNFADVRVGLEQQMRQRHKARVRDEYLRSLAQDDIIVTQESMEKMVERVFGKEFLARYAEDGDTQ